MLRSDDAGFHTLHAYFLDRLVPVCAQLLEAAAVAGETPMWNAPGRAAALYRSGKSRGLRPLTGRPARPP